MKLYRRSLSRFKSKGNEDQRVFCVSMQRTGTTSVGKFLREFGYRWAGWPADLANKWSLAWFEGNYEKIFSHPDFVKSNAFEDSPWFFPGFYKVLYHRFPGAKFILLTRDPDAWFQSMIKLFKGHVFGWLCVHSKVYRRESDYYDLVQSGVIDEQLEKQFNLENVMTLEGLADYYKKIYRLHNQEVIDFFERNNPRALFVGTLEDPQKWQKLGAFLGVEVPDNYEAFENKSPTTNR